MDKAFLRFGDSLLVRSCGGKDLAIGSVAINSTNYYYFEKPPTHSIRFRTQFVFAPASLGAAQKDAFNNEEAAPVFCQVQ